MCSIMCITIPPLIKNNAFQGDPDSASTVHEILIFGHFIVFATAIN